MPYGVTCNLTAVTFPPLPQRCRGPTSHSKHHRPPWGRPKHAKAAKDISWPSRSSLNPTRTTLLCHNNTTPGNRLHTQCNGPNVTIPICLTCKNCLHKCAADSEYCVTQIHVHPLLCSINCRYLQLHRSAYNIGELSIQLTT